MLLMFFPTFPPYFFLSLVILIPMCSSYCQFPPPTVD